MARTLKRKSRANEAVFRTAASAAAVVTAEGPSKGIAIPQIQEMQNIMDEEKSKMDSMRASYASQNCQLAKANSSLMMKLSDLEKNLSELVQENVALRSRISMSELDYKERLNKQLHVLEDGISHRFEEIFHMFDSIRRKEKLDSAPNSRHSTEIRSILSNKRASRRSSTYESRLSHHIQFLDAAETGDAALKRLSIADDHSKVNEEASDEDKQKRKRRKSSRRDSIFLSTDFDFYNEEKRGQENRVVDKDPPPQVQHEDLAENKLQDTLEEDPQQPEDTENLQGDGSFNFTNSIIEYSIPEETANSITNNEVDPPSSSKIEVFRDDQEGLLPENLLANDDINDNDNNKVNNNDNNSNKVTFIPVSSQNKVKHSMRPPNTRAGKKMVDEVMPIVGSGDIDFSRARRTRGKAINYTLPSLRAKMRRPTEKLVDATTITSIHDLQVKKHSKRFHRGETVDNSDFHELENESATKLADERHAPVLSESSATRIEKDCENSFEKESLESAKEKNIAKAAMKPILRDITNKPNLKPFKTKKLYKNAIVSDSFDPEDSFSGEPTRPPSNNSTRSHEEELSVFDLIGSNNIKQAHKTHRAKAKRVHVSK